MASAIIYMFAQRRSVDYYLFHMTVFPAYKKVPHDILFWVPVLLYLHFLSLNLS